MAKLILPDIEIVKAVNVEWPEPYQTEIMSTVSLCESGGDVFAHAPVTDPASVLYRWDDRGLLGINEGAINEVLDTRVDPRLFYIPELNVYYGRVIWDWRFANAIRPGSHGGLGLPYSGALIHAYSGWTTYKNRSSQLPQYAELRRAWPIFRTRVQAAMVELGLR